MASLLVGAGILISEKIRDKKAAKQEKKRKEHEAWYQDLENEHKKSQRPTTQSEKQTLNPDQTGSSSEPARSNSRSSRNSQDGPSRWVDEVNLEKTRSQTGR